VSVDGLGWNNEISHQFRFRVPLGGIGLNNPGVRWMVSLCQQLRPHFNLSAVGSVVLGVQTTEPLRKFGRFNLMLVCRKLTIQYFLPSIEHEFALWKI